MAGNLFTAVLTTGCANELIPFLKRKEIEDVVWGLGCIRYFVMTQIWYQKIEHYWMRGRWVHTLLWEPVPLQ